MGHIPFLPSDYEAQWRKHGLGIYSHNLGDLTSFWELDLKIKCTMSRRLMIS